MWSFACVLTLRNLFKPRQRRLAVLKYCLRLASSLLFDFCLVLALVGFI